ncbi:hypothetical protein AB0L47_02750 [Streptomyces bobili]|uniref:hypothetical protein n=1 Tax=Streptomyces TaxID=1883 RepID=UPI0029A98682|nr:hypothetical protein [Streptomyces sp. ID05-47C]MDX3570498.1 hypothetical protein [Streptomyces sp. ID05-47C]
MSADRETNHEMAHHEISLLLADAADEVEIGTAPTQALIRGGRRRRARRWAVAATTVLVVAAGSTTAALSGLPGGGDSSVGPAASAPSGKSSAADLLTPQRTTLATGTERGEKWRVYIDLWAAPSDESEAAGQLAAMGEYGEQPVGIVKPSELVGRASYFVHVAYGDDGDRTRDSVKYLDSTTEEESHFSGTDLSNAAIPLLPSDPDSLERLVIGQVAKSTKQVTCTWKDGTTDQPAIRLPEGSSTAWFVCVAPQGTSYVSAEVTA